MNEKEEQHLKEMLFNTASIIQTYKLTKVKIITKAK